MDVKYISSLALVKLCKTLRCPVIKFIRSFNAVCSPLTPLCFPWTLRDADGFSLETKKELHIMLEHTNLLTFWNRCFRCRAQRWRESALAAIRFSFSLLICCSARLALPCLAPFLRLCRMKNDKYGYRMQPIARCTVSCCRMKVYLWHFCFISPHLKLRCPPFHSVARTLENTPSFEYAK